MIEPMSEPLNNTQSELVSATAKIRFMELQRFFAQGKLLLVNPTIDLVEVATMIVNDQSVEINSLIETQKLSIPDDQVAKQWVSDDAVLWCVVVAPFVLVQELTDEHA